MRQPTQIFNTQVGGPGPDSGSRLVATSGPNEQLEVILTKRSSGMVRVTTSTGSSNPASSGVELPLDKPVEVRLGHAQRIYVVSDDAFNVQNVDIIIQPVAITMDAPPESSGNSGSGSSGGGGYIDTSCPPKYRR